MSGVNSKVIMLLLVLALGAGGYLWYSQMYTPALLLKDGAVAAAGTAQQGLDAANGELAAAQKRIEDAKTESAKPDESMARLAKASSGVPRQELIDDAAIVVAAVAREAGLETRFGAIGDDGSKAGVTAAAADPALKGATALDFEFTAGGTYAEFQHFFTLLESSTEIAGNSLYARGRLFNVEGFKTPESDDDDLTNPDAIILGKDEIKLIVTVRVYTSSQANSQGVGATTDAATAAAAGTAATPGAEVPGATPGAETTTPGATTPPAGTTPTDGTTPAATTPAATTPPAGTATPPAAAAAPGGLA